jgi:guanylate kinase
MKRRLILVGKGGSGKDHARKISENIIGAKYAISYTTRPPREGEVDGVDYYFIPMRTFNKMINEDAWYEYVNFNGWNYGTSKEQFDNDHLFIMTPKGLSHLSNDDRDESVVLFLDIPEDIRRERMAARSGNADSIERRLQADEADFKDFEDFDFKITNPDYRVDDIIEVWRKVNILEKLNTTN